MKRFLILITCLTILIAAGCSESPQEKQTRLYNEAVEALADYQFGTATEKFTEIREIEPDSPLPFYGKGLTYEGLHQYYDALRIYMTLTNSQPSFADAHGSTYRMLKLLDLPLDALEAAVDYRDLLTGDPDAALVMADALLLNNVPGRSHSYLDSALVEGANPGAVAMLRARTYIAQDDPDAADSVYEEGLAKANASADVYAQAVDYLENIGLIDSAVTMSRKAMELAGDNYRHTERHFAAGIDNNYFHVPRAILSRYKALGVPDSILYILEAHLYHAADKITLAKDALDKFVGLADVGITTRIDEAIIRMKASDERTMLQNFDALLVQSVNENWDDEFQELLIYKMGIIAGEMMEGPEAYTQLEKVREDFHGRRDYSVLMARAFLRTGRWDQFDSALAHVEKYYRTNPSWLLGFADIFSFPFVHEWDKAAEFYGRALERDLWLAPALENWVAMYRYLDQPEKAAELFDTYPHFPERFPELAMLEGICRVEAGQVERGTDLFLMNAGDDRGDMSLFMELYDALNDIWDEPHMERLAAWLAEHDSEIPDGLILASEIRADMQQFQQANQLADAAITLESDNLDAHAAKARALYGLGEVDAAIALLEENLSKTHYHIRSNYWLSRILALEGQDSHRAQNLARQAIFDSGQKMHEWLNLSFIYLQTGRYDLARGESLKMSRTFAGEPEPLYYLGVAYYMEGKNQEAQEKLNEAIEAGLAGPLLDDARSVLNNIKS